MDQGIPSASPILPPDVMNDPAYQTNSKGKGRGTEEPDTCRICRGEGSNEEPLFFPCKCSGSIKFVHQGCLMEWLSHSQKKHCELCKTPFRFTKLYHPQMPSTVPLPIFFRQAAIHTFKSFLVWSRWHLVVFVWLGWVPWCMRTVWRGLFWVGDGGWIDWQQMERQALSVTNVHSEELAIRGTTPVAKGLLLPNVTAASEVVSRLSNMLPPIWSPISQTLNFSTVEPTLFRLAKRLFKGAFYYSSIRPADLDGTNFANITTFGGSSHRSPSWLSEVKVLRSLTRWTTFNNMIIDVLEGQLITLFVVVAFILVFLIREWVVQQQPAINMEAAFNAAAAVEPPQEGNPAPAQIAEQRDERPAQEIGPDLQEVLLPRNRPGVLNEEQRDIRARMDARIIAAHRARRPVPPESITDTPANPVDRQRQWVPTEEPTAQSLISNASSLGYTHHEGTTIKAGQSNTTHRPSMPTRDVLATATEIRRTLEEHPRTVPHDWPGVDVFMDLWRRADHNPADVLRIIDEEGRGEELGWVVSVMDRLTKVPIGATSGPELHHSGSVDTEPTGEQSSNASNESWQVVEEPSTTLHSQTHFAADENIADDGSDTDDRDKGNSDSGANLCNEDASTSGSRPPPEDLAFWNKGKVKLVPSKAALMIAAEMNENGQKGPISDVPKSAWDIWAETSKDNKGEARLVPSKAALQKAAEEAEADAIEADALEADKIARADSGNGRPAAPQEAHGTSQNKRPSAANSTHTPPPASAPSHDATSQTDGLAEMEELDHRAEPDIASLNSISTQMDPEQPVQADPIVAVHDPRDFRERMMDWLWGGVAQQEVRNEEPGEDDEHLLRDAAAEEPFVPFFQGQLMIEDGNAREPNGQDAEVVDAAAEAGIELNDVEAIEDGEDLEGVMELIGMQGPLAGLVQNGMFCAVLISLTVFLGIWIPYIAGKLFLVFLANPISLLVKLPLRWASTTADLIIDTFVFCAACAFYWTDTAVRLAVSPVGWIIPFIARMNESKILSRAAWNYAHAAGDRLVKMFVATGEGFSDSDVPVFSIIAHESLNTMEQYFSDVGVGILNVSRTMAESCSRESLSFSEAASYLLRSLMDNCRAVYDTLVFAIQKTLAIVPPLLSINPLRISLDIPQRTRPLDFSLAQWSTRDRIVTIVLGYLFFFVAGAVYLRIRSAIHSAPEPEKRGGQVADILYQAGGVLKVILIISIEMIVFPLYCGLLLDGALLPLFENATALTRFQFTITSPATSLFVHWFVGTCYMFHFALFVAMCRKILRSGVLHFIRDPDDPTFHPVRDVLERSVSTQLRKIAFSALVYGALVIICLGSVVWGLSYALKGVFPIHWSSNEPVLEFPVDLLVYNFLMPLAVRFFTPSKGIKAMYEWWFRKCARALRLSHFLFDEKMEDEEGHFIRYSWRDLLYNKSTEPDSKAIPENKQEKETTSPTDHSTPTFTKTGRYVRAPASDQVRIPKGARTFVEVDQSGYRLDGLPDTLHGLHGRENKQFTTLYIPPLFRIRIGLFILLIWLFAASTGLGLTILPLLLGRRLFTHLIPTHQRMNDIYAFSIGIYVLGFPLYLLVRFFPRNLNLSLRPSDPQLSASLPNLSSLLSKSLSLTARLLCLTYFYTTTLLLLPALLATLVELYLLIPLHTYLSPAPPRHTIHAIQSWTLGVLALKAFTRLILAYSNTRPAQALRAIVAPPRGWLDPDVRLATRAFIFPGVVVMGVGVLAPLAIGWGAVKVGLSGAGEDERARLYRYAYPWCAAVGVGIGLVLLGARAVGRWRRRVRDEVYLVGERLHNFGEKRARV